MLEVLIKVWQDARCYSGMCRANIKIAFCSKHHVKIIGWIIKHQLHIVIFLSILSVQHIAAIKSTEVNYHLCIYFIEIF